MIRLYELRMERNLSQRATAKEMCISQATYNNWENGKTQPSIEQLIALARFFEVSVDFLIGNENDATILSPAHDEMTLAFYALDEEARALIKSLMQKLKK